MEREIIELRKQIASANAGSVPHPQQPLAAGELTPKQESSQVSPTGVYQTPSAMSADQYMGSQEAVASLLDLRSGFDGSNYMRNGNHQYKRIEDVMVVPEKVTELFNLWVYIMLAQLSVMRLTFGTDSSRTIILSFHSWTRNSLRTNITRPRLYCFGRSSVWALDATRVIRVY